MYFKANLHLIHVIEIPSSLQWAQSLGFAELAVPDKEGAQLVMNSLGDTFNLEANCLHIEIGSAYLKILALQQQLKGDLILLGGEPSHALPSLPGSTAHAVLHHASCDVLTMRAG
jgi:universal stress protein A